MYWACRVLYVHASNAFCEIGIIIFTLLMILSKQQHPAQASDSSRERILVMILSLMMTVLTLTLTVLGSGSAVAGLKVVAARVSAAGYNIIQGGRKTVQQVVPDTLSRPENVRHNTNAPEIETTAAKLGPSDLKWQTIGMQLTRFTLLMKLMI